MWGEVEQETPTWEFVPGGHVWTVLSSDAGCWRPTGSTETGLLFSIPSIGTGLASAQQALGPGTRQGPKCLMKELCC